MLTPAGVKSVKPAEPKHRLRVWLFPVLTVFLLNPLQEQEERFFLVKIGHGKVFDLLSPSSFIFIHCEQFLGKILPTY